MPDESPTPNASCLNAYTYTLLSECDPLVLLHMANNLRIFKLTGNDTYANTLTLRGKLLNNTAYQPLEFINSLRTSRTF